MLSDVAKYILELRYYQKDQNGNVIEDWDGLCHRVVSNIVTSEDKEKYYDKFFNMIYNLEFLPNSPTLFNAGLNGTLSGCFVLPVEDSMSSIFSSLKDMALIHQRGGGVGFNFSNLRPAGSIVKSSKGIATGPLSFMEIYDVTASNITQGGKREGANMGILNIDHPDIIEFIEYKTQKKSKLTNFNLSVGITDEFMTALKNDDNWVLQHPNSHIKKTIKAGELWEKIIKSAWACGDPGLIFLDNLNNNPQLEHLGRIVATNPCGEQPLLPYESCNLGSINLTVCLKENEFNFNKLGELVKLGIRFLDSVIDANNFILPAIAEKTLKTRKIGLGVMGFADVLFALGIKYDSNEGLDMAERIMSFIKQTADDYTAELGKEKGSYPACLDVYKPRRNACVTTIAPTGTISLIAGVSSGIEPNFDLVYKRKIKNARTGEIKEVLVENRFYKKYKDKYPKEVFVTAHEISPEWHLKMQSVFQKYVDSAVSKTINLPSEATHEDINYIYKKAYELKLKGITVYRDKSKDVQILEKPATTNKITNLPDVMSAKRFNIKTDYGTVRMIVSVDEKSNPAEVFIFKGKSGEEIHHLLEALGRLMSLILRSGQGIDPIIEQLQNIGGISNVMYTSIPDAIGKTLGEAFSVKPIIKTNCPDCGNEIVSEEGCLKCYNCGYSRC